MSDEAPRRVDLTEPQARVLADIFARKRKVEQEWAAALTLVGVDPEDVLDGNLDDDPHLLVRDDAAGPA